MTARSTSALVALTTLVCLAPAPVPTWTRVGVAGKSWMLDTGATGTPACNNGICIAPDRSGNDEGTPAKACPTGMQHVSGLVLQDDPKRGTVERLQSTTCQRWLPPLDEHHNPVFPERCASFDEARWRTISATLSSKPIDTCIDTYEFPNIEGQNPLISVTFVEAEQLCAGVNKRLCNEDEWDIRV